MSRWLQSRSGQRMVVMSVIFFLICVVHNVLHNMKDALVITAEGSGAEAIPYIQLWLLFPVTCAVTLWFAYRLRQCGLVKVMDLLLKAFLVFFLLFSCLLYPFRETIEPHRFAEAALGILPAGLKGFVAMGRHWVLSVFFVVAELWSCMVTSVIFWSLANEITDLEEAHSSYSWIRVGGALGAAVGGQVPLFTNFLLPDLSVYALMGVVIIGCLAVIVLFRYLLSGLVDKPIRGSKGLDSPRTGEGLMHQLGQLLRSRYLLCLAVMVVGYNLVMNLFELVWKAQLKELYPGFNDYNAFLGNASTACGLLTVLLALVVPKVLVRFGWTSTALISPIFHLITSLLFFGLLVCREYLAVESSLLLTIAIIVGAVQYSAGRASKYSLFDVSKDMAFIPLDSDTKSQGKAAVDGLGSRMGRSAASLIHQSLLLVFATVGGGIPVLAVFVVGVIAAWVGATCSLGRQIEEASNVPEKALPLAA